MVLLIWMAWSMTPSWNASHSQAEPFQWKREPEEQGFGIDTALGMIQKRHRHSDDYDSDRVSVRDPVKTGVPV